MKMQGDYILLSVGLALAVGTWLTDVFSHRKNAVTATSRKLGIGSGVLFVIAGVLLLVAMAKFDRGFRVLGLGRLEYWQGLLGDVDPLLLGGLILLGVAITGCGLAVVFGSRPHEGKGLPIAMPILLTLLSLSSIFKMAHGNLPMAKIYEVLEKADGGGFEILAQQMNVLIYSQMAAAGALLVLGILTAVTFIVWPREQA